MINSDSEADDIVADEKVTTDQDEFATGVAERDFSNRNVVG